MPYNEHEEKQIAYIHEQYRDCGLGEIPALLETEEIKFGEVLSFLGANKKIRGKYPAKKDHFEATDMNKQLNQGPLRVCAGNIVIKICVYQQERHSRSIGAGSLDDPINLLLEEVKHWAIHTLSAFSYGDDLKRQVNCRIDYLKMLEKSDDLFPSSRTGDLHFGATLLEVLERLQEAKIDIQATLDSASAEKELEQLVFSAKNLVQHVTQYVYFIFRSEASDDFTFENVRHPHQTDKRMQNALKTRTGEFLLLLLNSIPFLRLFPDEKAPELSAPVHSTALVIPPVPETFQKNPFVSKDLLPTKENQADYGIYSAFLACPNIIASFIELHALLLELGHFTLICGDLKGLARWGGDILIYGLTNQSVALFMQSYFNLINSISIQLGSIRHLTQSTYKAQKKAASHDEWLKSYNKAESIYSEIEKDKLLCDRYASDILAKAGRGIDENQRKKIQAQIMTVLGSVAGFSQRMHSLFSGDETERAQLEQAPPKHAVSPLALMPDLQGPSVITISTQPEVPIAPSTWTTHTIATATPPVFSAPLFHQDKVLPVERKEYLPIPPRVQNTNISGNRTKLDQTKRSSSQENVMEQKITISSKKLNKKGLFFTPNKDLSTLLKLPEDFIVGEAIDDGGCFFDALAQSMNRLKKTTQYTEKSLRVLCHEFYLANKEKIDEWNKEDGGLEQSEEYLMVQYTNPELEGYFHGRPPVWGRGNVEGRILCEKLNLVAIHLIELVADPESHQPIVVHHLITKEKMNQVEESDAPGYRENIPILVVSQKDLHFIPVFSDDVDLEEDFLSEQEKHPTPRRELILRRDNIPEYIKRSIAGFNDKALEAEIASQWQAHFESQMCLGGKGKPKPITVNEVDEAKLELLRKSGKLEEKLSPEQGFLYEFEHELHFQTAGPLSKKVTDIVKTFETNHLDYQKPKGLLAWCLNEDNLWEIRHHELFCLKYLCIMAAKSDNTNWSDETDERDLKDFIEYLNNESPTARLNFLSDYRKLKNELITVYQDILKRDLELRKFPRNQGYQIKENKRLKAKSELQDKIMQEQENEHKKRVSQFRDLVEKKDELINKQNEELKKRDSAIEERDETIKTQSNTIKKQIEINAGYDIKFRQQELINTFVSNMLLSRKDLTDEERDTIRCLFGSQNDDQNIPTVGFKAV